MHEISVAVVGCGYVANDHLKAWRKVSQAEVMAVIDLNGTIAKSTAELWKIPHYYTSLSELIKNNRIDLVDICTPPHAHAALAVQAIKAETNVLIEKPMTITVKDAQEIVKARNTTGVKAGVIHNWLFEPPVMRASSLLKEGRLGEVFSVEIEALCTQNDAMVANEQHWSHRLPGGRFSENLAHPIYLIRHFLGEIEVSEVQVSKIGDHPWMKSDELCAIFKGEKGLGRAYISFNAPRDAIFISLYGREAILKLDIINATINILPKREASRFNKGVDSLRQAAQLVSSTFGNTVQIAFRHWFSGHDMCIKLFAESLINNIEPRVTVEDGLTVVKILEEMCGMIEKKQKTVKTQLKSRACMRAASKR